MPTKNLRQYIKFLHKNHFAQEAQLYETTVVKLLNDVGYPDPLKMSTREVVATLYDIQASLASRLEAEGQGKSWEVELHG